MEQRNHLDELHSRLLDILPRIELHGRIYFRHLSPDRKADAIQEMRALAWKWFLRRTRSRVEVAKSQLDR